MTGHQVVPLMNQVVPLLKQVVPLLNQVVPLLKQVVEWSQVVTLVFHLVLHAVRIKQHASHVSLTITKILIQLVRHVEQDNLVMYVPVHYVCNVTVDMF